MKEVKKYLETKKLTLSKEMNGYLIQYSYLCNMLKEFANKQSKDKQLAEIRNELLLGVENSDLLYIKMQINNIDTLLYNTNNNKVKVICICGSTRFADLHAIKRWEFEQEGHIGLMINYLPESYAKEHFGDGIHDHFGEKTGKKELLDQLHFRKIDLSDEVYIINYNGYIGESTRNEINYAESKGIPVVYMEK